MKLFNLHLIPSAFGIIPSNFGCKAMSGIIIYFLTPKSNNDKKKH